MAAHAADLESAAVQAGQLLAEVGTDLRVPGGACERDLWQAGKVRLSGQRMFRAARSGTVVGATTTDRAPDSSRFWLKQLSLFFFLHLFRPWPSCCFDKQPDHH